MAVSAASSVGASSMAASSVAASSVGASSMAASSVAASSVAASSTMSASSASAMVTLNITPGPGYWSTSAAPFVTLIANPGDAQIWYTTDGTMPIMGSSPQYTAGFTLDRTTVVRAIGTKVGLIQSTPLEAHFVVAATKTLATGQDVSHGTGSDGMLKHGYWKSTGRFILVSANTLQDTLTGLQWTKATNGMQQTWDNALTLADSASLDGYMDWRLPNVRELESLINYGVVDPAAWLRAEGFDAALPAGYYWTSTSWEASSATEAWAVNFGTDDQRVIPLGKSTLQNILFVRGTSSLIPKTGQTTYYGTGSDGNLMYGASDPAPRFVYANNRLVDRRSGLVWHDTRTAQTGWTTALTVAEGLNYGADADWHCPNVRQIFSLVNFGVTDTIGWIQSLVSIGWVNDQLAWSSTVAMHDTSKCWHVNLTDGRVTAIPKTAASYTLMPIRGGMLIP